MRRMTSENTFGAKKWLLRPYRIVPTVSIRRMRGGRQSERWFSRVYNLFMNNGWVLRHKSNEHLGY